ncbi:5'-nucleotidase C-terminal domain-containing protein [Acinetobacter indicus]
MNVLNKKTILSIACLSVFMTACGDNDRQTTTPTPVVEGKAVELNILHINDHHSHLDEEHWNFSLAQGAEEENYSVSRGGFARVAGLINRLTEEYPNVIKLHSGDAITGDLYFNLSEGKADADAMNTVCFDSFVLGNHEFDAKDAGLQKFINYLDAGNCATPTRIVSANVNFGSSSPLYQTQRIEKSFIFERDGEKFAIIGLTIADKTKNASQPNSDTTFANEIEAAQQEIDRLKAQGIHKIILQTHTGFALDQQLAAALTDVDVIVGGDSHTLLGPDSLKAVGLSPSGAYPTQARNKDGDLVCIAQAWQYSYVVGDLKVRFNPQGQVEQCSGTPHILVGDDFKRENTESKQFEALNATEQAALLERFKAANIPMQVVSPYTATLNVLLPYQQQKQNFASTVVAQATDNLCLRRVPGTQRDTSRSSLGDICNQNPHVIAHGGDIQQMIAEAFLQQGKVYFDADLSFQNGGGVRVDVAAGPVTVEKIYQVLPFKNTLVRLDMTGAEIKATLEDAISGVVEQRNTGSYPYTGGLRWQVDLTQAKGQRISQLEVRNTSGSYEALVLDRTYKVVTIDFLANGQDYYSSMKEVTGERRMDVGLDYAEAFLQYVERLPGTTGQKSLGKLPTADYSTQKFTE